MLNYRNIGVPSAFQNLNIINPLEEAKKIAKKTYHAPGTSPMEKERKKYWDRVNRINEREEQERRYEEFLQNQRDEADKIRRQKKKQLEIADQQRRKEKEDFEKMRDAEFEKEFQQRITDDATYKPTGEFSQAEKDRLDNPLNRWLHRQSWDMNNWLGSLFTDKYSTYMTELSGRVSMNQIKEIEADAHAQMLDIDRNIEIIKNQKQLLLDSANLPMSDGKTIFSEEYRDRQKYIQSEVEKYDAQIKALEQKKTNSDLKQLDDEYKMSFIRDNGGLASYIWGEIKDAPKEFFSSAEERKQIYTDRRNKMLAKYPEYLQKYISEKGDLANKSSEDRQKALITQATTWANRAKDPAAWNHAYMDKMFANDLEAVKKYKEDLRLDNENLKTEYTEVAKQLQDSQNYWKMAKSMEQGKQIYSNAGLFDWNYWRYEAGSMIGSSNSSPAQLYANAIQGGSALVAIGSAVTGVGTTVAPVIANAGMLASAPFQVQSGFGENYGETSDKRADSLKNALYMQQALYANKKVVPWIIATLKKQSVDYFREKGMSNEWIHNRYFNGTETELTNVLQDHLAGISKCSHPILKRAMFDSAKGIATQFWADNVRTMNEVPVQILMSMYPGRLMKKAGEVTQEITKGTGKALAKTKAAQAVSTAAQKVKSTIANTKTGKVVSDVFGNRVAKNVAERTKNYANGFRRHVKSFRERAASSFEAGETAAEALGYGYTGSKVIGAGTAAVNEVLHQGSKLVGANAIAAVRDLTDDIMRKYQLIYDKLLPKQWMRMAAIYGMNSARRGFLQAMSEGAEEGVQYLNSKEDFGAKYGFSTASLGDLLVNDFTQGGRIKDAYLSLLGIGNSPLDDDMEFWQNVKGGFALGGMGGLHIGQVVNVIGNIANAKMQYTTNQLIERSAVLDRSMDQKERASNFVFAKLAMNNREAEVANRMQELYEADKHRENTILSQEDYDEKTRAASSVMNMTKNKQIRGMLEAKGIEYGTDEYATAIADLYTLQSQQLQNSKESKENSAKLDQLYSSPEFKQEIANIANRVKQDIGFGLAISRRRVEAGEKAVKEHIEAAKKAGVDTNTPEFAIELQQVRKDAQKQVEDEINDKLNNRIERKSRLVNRAKALLRFKAQQNSAKDFFDLLSNKLNLRTIRPDAKTIMDNTTSQIDEIKKQLKELDPDLNLGETEADFLKALEGIDDVVVHNTDEIQQHELNGSVLRADAAVTNSYLNQFSYGVVKNKKGKYEYNKKQYENEKNRTKRYLDAILAGNKEEAEKIQQEDVTSEYDEADVANNEYKTRVNKIIEADQQNMALDAMVAEAYSGDLVNRYMDQLKQEYEEMQKQKEQTKPSTTNTTVDPFTGKESTMPENGETRAKRKKASRKAKIAKNRELYEKRKKKAEEIYKKIKKSLRKNAYGSFIPALPQLTQASAYLLSKAATGVYKINEFIQDLKDVVSDIDIDAILPQIKDIYSKYAAQAALLNNPILQNLSTPEEIFNYVFQDNGQDVAVDTYSNIQSTIKSDENKILHKISTYYFTIVEESDDIVICKNTEAINHRNESDTKLVNSIKRQLDKAINSEDEFKQTLEELTKLYENFPVDEYMKYRGVDGITEAIANHIVLYNPSEGVINGIKARNAVLGILLDKPYLLEDISDFKGKEEFIKDITRLKQQLSSAGYKIVDVNQILFDTKSKTAVQTDVICVNENGKIQVIDVLSSYANIAARYDYKPGDRAIYTIKQREEDMLHLIERILYDRFGVNVNTLSVLPIHCDHKEIFVQKKNGKTEWQFVTPKLTEKPKEELQTEQFEQSTKQQVAEINDIIEQYNQPASENKLNKEKISSIEWVEQPSFEQYQDYSEQLQEIYENISQNLIDLQKEIQDKLEQDKYEETFEIPYNDDEIPQAALDNVNLLSEACRELDTALSNAPDIKATTREEKEAVNKLYQCIFDAQQALNDVLLNEESNQINVQAEQELIASAMEHLAENPNFDKLQKFVQKQWLDSIVLNTSKQNTQFVAKNQNEQFTAYFNTIQNWINTLYGHVMQDLENNPRLQDWYDTLLNVYFAKLLDNAQSFINKSSIKEDLKEPFNQNIKEGRDMLSDFNGQFSMRPDKEYPTAPKDAAEKLNRISQKYSDLYTESTAHSPAYDAMLYSDPYYFMSRHDDFAEKATVSFEIAKKSKRVGNKRNSYGYDINEGDVIMVIRYQNPDGSFNFAELPLITSEGYNPSNNPEVISRIRKMNNVNRKFSQIVKQALQIVKDDPNKKIVYTTGVHRGRIRYGKRTDRHNVTEFIFKGKGNEKDLYTITISKENNLGLAAFTINNKTGEMGYGVYAGPQLKTRIGGFDDLYKKQKLRINNGALIYFYETGDGDRIGTPIENEQIGEASAIKLVDLMQKYVQGQRTENGYDIHSLLSMRLYIEDPSKKLYSVNNTNNLIRINDNGVISIGNATYDIQSQKQALIQAVSQMRNVVDNNVLNENITTSDNSVFSTARQYLKSSGSDIVELPNGIVFTKEDFVHRNSDGSFGTTWLGYMLRNNLLYTTAIGRSYKQIYVDGFKVINKNDENIDSSTKTKEEVKKQQKERRQQGVAKFNDLLNNLKGQLRYVSEHPANQTTDQQFTQQMREYLYKTLGKDDSIFQISNSRFLDRVPVGYVLGYCTSQAIKLCASAPMSVGYHEAFHRVFELLISDKVRDNIYSAYKKNNKNIKTDRDVAEALADNFVSFMDKTEGYRDAHGLKSVVKFYKYAAQYFGLVSTLGFTQAYNMMSVYSNMNAGKYANSEISQEKINRFEKLFGDKLAYTVRTKKGEEVDFKYLRNSSDIHDMVKSLSYWIAKSIPLDKFSVKEFNIKNSRDFVETLPDGLIDMLCGNDLEESERDDINRAFAEVFSHDRKLIVAKNGNSAYKTVYPKLDYLVEQVKDYINSTITKFTEESDQYSDETLDEEMEKAMSKNIEKYDAASFESSKIDALPDNVKFFFATIPYMIKTSQGIQLDLTKNKFGQPEFMPINRVINLLINDLYKCESIQELDKTLQAKSETSVLFKYVYDKYHALYQNTYSKDQDGNITVDYNAESYCINILSALHSQKIDFIVATSKQQDGGKEIQIKSSSLDRDKYTMTKQWYNILVSGQVSVFNRGRDKNNKLTFKENMGGKNGNDVFSKTAQFIQSLVTGAQTQSGKVTINEIDYDLHDTDDLNDIKNLFVNSLNNIGIIMSRDALDYMLSTAYIGDDTSTFEQLLTNKGVENIQSFIDKLNNIVSNNGIIDENAIKDAYCKCGFVSNLATYSSKYRRSCIESMALGLNGKKLHAVSQNNTISFIVNQLNTRDKNNPTIHTLMKYGYNLTGDGPLSQGSIILEHILNGKQLDIHTATYIGSKSDNRNDGGSEYKEEPMVDDYMAKLTMLQNGILTFPTLADKGTWMCLSGIPIPGMQFVETRDKNGNVKIVPKNIPTIIFKNGKAFIRPNNAVLDRMIAYANTERLAIQQCMENLGYKEIPGYERENRKVLSDAEKIVNLHTNNGNVEPNGTRFLSLTEVALLDEDGTVKLDDKGNIATVNLNNPTKSSVEMLKLANENFFTKKEGETDEQFLNRQRNIMAYTLNVQYDLEVQNAIDLGIVERTQINRYDAKSKEEKVLYDKDDKSIYNLDSKYLNVDQVHALTLEILKTIPKWNNLPAGRERTTAYECCKGMAIAAILSDATTKSIISANEVQRCFIGNPALFKVRYEGDHIKDSTFDIQKRIGGIVSTGDDNAKQIPGIPRTYSCAECKDYKVSSGSDIRHRLKDMFIESSVRDMWAILMEDKIGKECWQEVFEKNVDDLLNDSRLSEKDKNSLQKAYKNGEKFASAFDTKDINVADGQAYITEEMCENLLRLRGALTDRVKQAFDLLKGEEKYSWQQKADAYKTVYDAVNLVTTKYTAYGFRDHQLNEEDCSDVAVAYYNKYSLAPLFSCLATGNMHDIYQKMKDEKVDMLLMTSAIKVGSQGAVSYNGESINESFNKYEQDYSYLRRQMNTDPEEGDTSSLGTQMIKIVLQNLRLDRINYTDSKTGNKLSGQEILNSLMSNINELADIAYDKVCDEFGINKDRNTVDNKKLSQFLKKQLSSRSANKGLLEAVSLDENGNFNCPIAATTDSKWIESILISIISKRIVDIVTPGNSFVQRSVFAMEDSQASENKIQSDKNMSPKINGGNKLQMINEDGSMDAVISIDYFESILPKDLSFDQARQWLIDNGIIGPKANANTIGYRIPTQAQSSIHALRFVDVVSAVKCTIILPEEFTKITGSDFDIDHLYLATLNYEVDENGNVIRDENKLSREKQLQNSILNHMMTLLKDTENSMHSLYKSIDNDTELLTNISDQIPEQANSKRNAYNFGTLHEQIHRRNDYITGKFGIGPFALNVTNHILTRAFGVKFKNTRFTEAVGLVDLGKIVDEDNNYIDSWLSAFINAHVDIVKDPYISKMNVNKFTYNMVNLLIRAGFGESAMWFMTQPIIVEMAKASNAANSQFMRTKGGGSIHNSQQEQITKAVLKYVKADNISKDKINTFLDFTNKESVEEAIDCVLFIKNNKELLKNIVINGDKLNPNDKVSGDLTLSDVQEKMFFAWKALEKYSIAFGNLVQRSKIDTKKQGKSLIAVNNYYNNYMNMFYPEDETQSLFDVQTLHNLAEKSWIQKKTDYVCKLPFIILGKQTFEGNSEYMRVITDIYKQLNPNATSVNIKSLEKINTAVKSQIKAQYIAKYAKEYLNKTDKDITNLFVGNRCMAYRLNMLNSAIRQNPKYKRLANNALIQQLYTLEDSNEVYIAGSKCKKPCFISIADAVGDNTSSSDIFIDAWEDLLNDYDPNVRNFARDLIVYAYMTSGENAGWSNLFKYVPPAWTMGKIDKYQSFSDFVKQRLELQDFDNYINLDDIAANNYREFVFSKPLFDKDQDGNKNIIYNSNDGILALSSTSEMQSPMYLVYKTERGIQQSAYQMYKLVKYAAVKEGFIPIYQRIPIKGFTGFKKQMVLEYGWSFDYAENKVGQNKDYSEFLNKLNDYLLNHPEEANQSDFSKLVEAVSTYEVEKPQIEPQTTENKVDLGFSSMRDLVMNSGGAHGADTAWDFYARKYGVSDIRHYRDQNNSVLSKPLDKKGIKASIVTKEQLDFARDQIYKRLGIKYSNNIMGNLQARNYYQVANSDAVFAIALMNDSKNSVSGGTNTAVQLGISMKKPVHVFDIKSEQWYKYNPQTAKFEVEDVPMLTKNFAGVGTRDIEDYQVLKDGKWQSRPQYVGEEKAKIALKAIQDVMAKTQSALNDNRKQPGSNTTSTQTSYINVYSGTGDHIYLSNFANRPFETKLGVFNTVEGAFQAAKLYYTNGDKYVVRNSEGKVTGLTEEGMSIVNKLKTADGITARKIGRSISDLNTTNWDNHSYKMLERFMRMSFEQNPMARKSLTDTGDDIITHRNQQGIEQDNGRFSEILTKLRGEFKSLLPDPNSTKIEQHVGDWSRDEVENNPNYLYIFTDNTDRDSGSKLIDPNSKYAKKYGQNKHYPKVTQAVIRGLDNAMPLSTQHWYHYGKKGKNGVWTDADIEEFKKVIDQEIDDIIKEWNTGKYEKLIVGDGDAFFNSNISNISITRVPKLYQYLKQKVQELYNTIDNGTQETNFLKELGMSDEDMKKAQEIKNHCKGGK